MKTKSRLHFPEKNSRLKSKKSNHAEGLTDFAEGEIAAELPLWTSRESENYQAVEIQRKGSGTSLLNATN